MSRVRVLSVLAAGGAAGAAAATAVDLLDGADPRWTVAANLLLVPSAAVLAGDAGRAAAGPVAALCWLGVPVGLVGAALGDRAGGTWWRLALEASWWIGVALAVRSSRPGLAVLTGLAAVSASASAAITGLQLPQPVAAGAGLPAAMTVAWAAWAALDLAVRPAAGSNAPAVRPR
ncbi:MAG TPA: hypothetical protein VGJ95_01380 [Pseudonocardiaceae bacterium]|jgi:hypothetical protein